MNEIAEILYSLWNGFGIKAYQQNRIPNNATLPYIVYRVKQGATFGEETDYIQLFYDTKNAKEMYDLADKIRKEIGIQKLLRLSSGNIIITQINWQDRPDADNDIALYGNFSIQYNVN